MNAAKSGNKKQRPSAFWHYRVLLAKDLRQEFRTREMLTSMGIYSLLVLVIFGTALAQSTTRIDIQQMAGGLIWALIVFTSLLGLNRSFAHEREEGALSGVLLVPMDRSVIFLAKATSNFLFLLLVELITIPLFYFLLLSALPLAQTTGMLVLPVLAGTIGFAGIGTLLATITINTRGKDLLLALLFVPLAFPLLYACVAATTVAITGSDTFFATYWPALALAGGYDVVMLLVSWLLYEYVVSA